MIDKKILETTLSNELKRQNMTQYLDKVSQLVDYVILLNQWNKIYNLTSVRDPLDMLEKHIIDSLAAANYIDQKYYADVGTGPGLPGIPLAIIFPDKIFYLIETLGKRINFLNEARRTLKLKNIIPIKSRCEDLKIPHNISFDGIISRAFASLSEMLNLCSGIANKNTKFIAFKGQINNDEIKSIPNEYIISDIIKLKVPASLGCRNLIIIKKV